jgi:hypothetical protein
MPNSFDPHNIFISPFELPAPYRHMATGPPDCSCANGIGSTSMSIKQGASS